MEGSAAMTDADRVLVTVADGVADVRLNRPDKLNALDGRMFAALADTGARLADDPSVRAVVLSGEGRAFCAGLDLSTFQAVAGEGAREGAGRGSGDTEEPVGIDGGLMSTEGRITHLGQQASWTWRELPVPVIAAITGPCLGGGLQIALGADIRIVAPDAKLSVLEMRWGLIPDMTGTWVLPRLVGDALARELTYTGRMISGEEAAAIGLASRTSDDPRAEALALAAEIAAKSPVAIRHAKRLLEASVTPGRTVAEQFLDERSTMAALMGSADNIEAVTAYFEQRTPTFPDPAV
jgi:enoyl-CoA hydratase/carnithine racemase